MKLVPRLFEALPPAFQTPVAHSELDGLVEVTTWGTSPLGVRRNSTDGELARGIRSLVTLPGGITWRDVRCRVAIERMKQRPQYRDRHRAVGRHSQENRPCEGTLAPPIEERAETDDAQDGRWPTCRAASRSAPCVWRVGVADLERTVEAGGGGLDFEVEIAKELMEELPSSGDRVDAAVGGVEGHEPRSALGVAVEVYDHSKVSARGVGVSGLIF